jgi:hypothetical protein
MFIIIIFLLLYHLIVTNFVTDLLREIRDEQDNWLHYTIYNEQYDKTEPNSLDSSNSLNSP